MARKKSSKARRRKKPKDLTTGTTGSRSVKGGVGPLLLGIKSNPGTCPPGADAEPVRLRQ